jgi:hypothetical protein
MMAAAVIWWIIAARLPDRGVLRCYQDEAGAAPARVDGASREAARKSRRKLRKKLR